MNECHITNTFKCKHILCFTARFNFAVCTCLQLLYTNDVLSQFCTFRYSYFLAHFRRLLGFTVALMRTTHTCDQQSWFSTQNAKISTDDWLKVYDSNFIHICVMYMCWYPFFDDVSTKEEQTKHLVTMAIN